jgi:O-antigen/teichoic acid export membrane protein
MRLSHIAWNLCGLTLPLGVAVITVPHLIEKLGQERFGLLALAWGLIGYAGALDLGMGRALTQMVARLRGERSPTSIPAVLATTGRITLVTGLIGGALISLFASLGGADLFRASSIAPKDIQYAILLLAVALPAQAMSATYRGLNEALQNFRGISLLRAGLGVVNFAGPYVVSLFTTRIFWLVVPLVVSRLIALFIFRKLAVYCLRKEPGAIGAAVYSRAIARDLFSFGGWVTVSSVISPILVQADRFVIAATISAAAVSIYVVPYEVVAQSLILVGAISSVMFPGLSMLVQEKPSEWQPYFQKWLLRVAGMMAFSCTLLAILLPILMPLWIKNGLPPESIRIGQVLCLGVFANSIGSMFYSLLHAKGRADVTARLHAVELVIYIVMLSSLIHSFGVLGAAWAWVGRMTFDAIALACIARRYYA